MTKSFIFSINHTTQNTFLLEWHSSIASPTNIIFFVRCILEHNMAISKTNSYKSKSWNSMIHDILSIALLFFSYSTSGFDKTLKGMQETIRFFYIFFKKNNEITYCRHHCQPQWRINSIDQDNGQREEQIYRDDSLHRWWEKVSHRTLCSSGSQCQNFSFLMESPWMCIPTVGLTMTLRRTGSGKCEDDDRVLTGAC